MLNQPACTGTGVALGAEPVWPSSWLHVPPKSSTATSTVPGSTLTKRNAPESDVAVRVGSGVPEGLV